ARAKPATASMMRLRVWSGRQRAPFAGFCRGASLRAVYGLASFVTGAALLDGVEVLADDFGDGFFARLADRAQRDVLDRGELAGGERFQPEVVGIVVDQRLQPPRLHQRAEFGAQDLDRLALLLDRRMQARHPLRGFLGAVLHVVGDDRADDHDREQGEVDQPVHAVPFMSASSGSAGTPMPRRLAGSSGRLAAAVRRPARRRAERARALSRISASPGVTAARVSNSKVAGASSCSGRWREPPGRGAERSARKRLTIRSSSEWKETTTSRAPSPRISSEAASARASSSSSWLM